MSLTECYNKYGVSDYYIKFAEQYSNPHLVQINELVVNNINRIRTDNVLDLGCGSGEVSHILQSLNYNNISGCDPYMSDIYIKNIAKPCLKLSFDDIIKQGLSNQYSSIICSFAMHLCDKKKLSALIYRLAQVTSQIIIITPHKRPEIENMHNFKKIFSDKSYTNTGKAVHLKIYLKT